MQNWEVTLASLRDRVDLAPYTPDLTSPYWLQGATRIGHNDPGVLALLGPNGLSIAADGIKLRRVEPDAPCLLLSGIADRLRSTGRRIAIGLPPVARHLPLLLAGTSVLANVVDKSSMVQGRGDGSVLIVSPDLDARSRYCDLHVASELLDDAYPGSRMRPDGHQVPLRAIQATRGVHGVCFFLPLLSLPTGIAVRPSTIVLDVRYARWVKRITDLAAWTTKVGAHAGIVALYSLGDVDTRQALITAGFKDFPFDQSAVVACAQHMQAPAPREVPILDWDIAASPSFLRRDHEVSLVPQNSDVEQAFSAANRLLFEHTQQNTPTLRRARWILAALNHLPVPVVVYEYSARSLGRRTLKSLIDGLGSQRSASSGYTASYGAPSMSSGERALKEALDHLFTTLWQSNPREEQLRAILPDIASQVGERQLLLLVRDPVVERAVQSWIADEAFPGAPWASNVLVRVGGRDV